ncbi:MAG: GAF domain-containing protein [Candidatus Aminicenantes bacterium]|nr:GAF domain-containing protein [Candidatus Aminicenantes bacterium]
MRVIYRPSVFLALFIYLLASIFILGDQYEEIRFKHLTLDDGLSQSTVFCILQDEKGFLWFGTEDGMNKYDGKKIIQINPEPGNPNSLTYNYIGAIYEDSEGFIWIGTQGGGLDRYDPEVDNFTHFRSGSDPTSSLSDNFINVICQCQHGIILIGTNNGLNILDPQTGRFLCYQNDPDIPGTLSDNQVSSLLVDRNDTIWVGTYNGLNHFKHRDDLHDQYQNIAFKSDILSHKHVTTLYEDKNSTIWIGTETGLYHYNEKTEDFIQYQSDPYDPFSLSSNHIYSICEDRFSNIWIGTMNGLNLYDRVTQHFRRFYSDPSNPTSLINNSIRSLLEDRTGVFWVGTHSGLSRFDQEGKKFNHIHSKINDPNSLSSSDTYSIYLDKEGTFWIGTYGGGLNKYIPEQNKYIHYRHDPHDPYSLSNNYIRTVTEDHNGTLWIGTNGGGLNRFNPKQEKFFHYQANPTDPKSISSDQIRWIFEDSTHSLWIGTINGLNKYDRKNDNFLHFMHDPKKAESISNDFVYIIFEDKNRTLWIGTLEGLNRYDRETKTFYAYFSDPDNVNSLSSSEILAMYEDKSGRFWIGTGVGLNYFDRKNQKFTRYTVKEGLPNNVIYAIGEDNSGNLWISTNKGLSKFDPLSGTFRNFDVKDGLQSNEFNLGAVLVSPNGEMYFGGINGIVRFYPDEIKDNPFIPPVVITDVQVFNRSILVGMKENGWTVLEKTVPYSTEIKLSHKARLINIEFAALHYASPENNRYKYKMEGLEDAWYNIGEQHFASFTNIPPGNYAFRVIASNNDNLWNNEGTTLRIIIIPPFWKTLWFRGALLLSIFLLLFMIYKIRTRSIRERNIELEKHVRKRTLDLQKEIAERRRLEGKAKREAMRTALIYEASKKAISKLDLGELLHDIVNSICESFNYYGVIIFLLDEKKNRLNFKAASGVYAANIPRDISLSLGQGMVGQAALSGKVMVSGDVSKDPYFIRLEAEFTKSELSVPIKTMDKIIGVLDIQSDKLKAFDESDIAAMKTLSTQIAHAIENANLYEHAQKEIIERKKTEKTLLKREKQIKASLEEKEVLLKEIHHRVKNNMQIISSLLRLQTEKIKDKTMQNMFIESQNRIQSMALIHETLYKSKDLARIDFHDYLKRLTSSLSVLFQKNPEDIQINYNIKNVHLDINQAIPCGLLINELITNSLKHAFPDGGSGTVDVHMSKKPGGRFSLMIQDSGIGLPDGIDLNHNETLGMQLISGLISQLNGKIQLHREKGTKYTIEF